MDYLFVGACSSECHNIDESGQECKIFKMPKCTIHVFNVTDCDIFTGVALVQNAGFHRNMCHLPPDHLFLIFRFAKPFLSSRITCIKFVFRLKTLFCALSGRFVLLDLRF